MIKSFFLVLSMLTFTSLLNVHAFSIPPQFRNGQPIEQVILISDVDGVIRESTEDIADPRVIQAVKSLLNNKGIDVTFISGTPIESDQTLEIWKRGNLPLNKVFGSSFSKELSDKRVTIYGVLGGHRMQEDGSLEVVDEYSKEASWELGKLLIHAFLQEVLNYGTSTQQVIAKHLQVELDALSPKQLHSSNETAQDFHQIVMTIRQYLDPSFRLISNGALIETQTSNPPWTTLLSFEWLKDAINQPQHLISKLPLAKKKMATGFAKKGEGGFNYLIVSKTNKGITTKEHIEEKIKIHPNALIITIGDTQVDFPMHENAHIAFHVGLEQVWLNNRLPHCMLIRNESGKDAQHVEGTLKVLALLEDAVGKSFYDFKHIPQCDALDQWSYYSIRELQPDEALASPG
jgi:hypothetical protein